MTLTQQEQVALNLLERLDARGYDFVTVTPESHRRVVARPAMQRASDLRGVFGWSLPFDETVVGAEMFALLRKGDLLQQSAAGWKSRVRVSRVEDSLFLHSAFPTDSDESVFLGPDTLRFIRFIAGQLADNAPIRRLVDIGTGAGVGGIVTARWLGPATRVELADINRHALSHARVNAVHAGVAVTTIESDGLDAVAPGFDLAIANPPFIIDDAGPAYRAGGGMHGAELSLKWALDAARKLAPGGRILLYTGSAIVAGRDALRQALERDLPPMGCRLAWRELDPDIFGEELAHAAYQDVDRIAAIGAVIEKTETAKHPA